MAEEDNVEIEPITEEEEPTTYKPPPEKSLQEMIETDKEDESLRKYKEKLLGNSATGAIIIGEFVDGGTVMILLNQHSDFVYDLQLFYVHLYTLLNP